MPSADWDLAPARSKQIIAWCSDEKDVHCGKRGLALATGGTEERDEMTLNSKSFPQPGLRRRQNLGKFADI